MMSFLSYIYSIPYISVFLILVINSIPFYNKKRSYSFILQTFFLIVVLIIFFGLRGLIFTDWRSYSKLYEITPSIFDGITKVADFLLKETYERWERGFLLYVVLCKSISGDYFFFQFISFLIDFIIIYYFFKQYSSNIFLGFAFFFVFGALNIEVNLMRNAKAIGLFFISARYIAEKKIFNYVLLNIIGSLFHTTALLFLPLYFILNRQYPKKVILCFFIIGNIIYLFQIHWCRKLLEIVAENIDSNSRLGFLLDLYLSSDNIASEMYGIKIGYLERSFSFVLFYVFSDKLIVQRKTNIIFINTLYIYLFIYLFFSEMSVFLTRLSLLFIFSYWILYPIIYSLLPKSYKLFFLGVLICYGSLKLLMQHNNIITLYDNILFGYKNYNERCHILNTYYRYIREL